MRLCLTPTSELQAANRPSNPQHLGTHTRPLSSRWNETLSPAHLCTQFQNEAWHRASAQDIQTNEGTGRQALDPGTAGPPGAPTLFSAGSISTNGAVSVPGPGTRTQTQAPRPLLPQRLPSAPGRAATLPRPCISSPKPSLHCHHTPHASPWAGRSCRGSSRPATVGETSSARPAL